ncbi:MAG: NADH-quinone oxidoreductase subunit N [Ignavibacteria bacterium]|nr:NADH-quinone oxidoreductase subunit N [Ignavibacteria bacterium]
MIKLIELQDIMPLLIIAGSAIITLLMASFSSKSKIPVFVFSMASVLAALVFTARDVRKTKFLFNDSLELGMTENAFAILAMLAVLITLISSRNYLINLKINYGEYYSLMLFALFGMLLMIYGNDMLIIFIGLESMSVCFYVFAGMMRKREKSNESAMKYFLLGAFMTGFLLFGISLIYGVTGYTNITKILTTFTQLRSPIFLLGVILFTIGFLFKMGIFPFQMWVPDVYEGAPTIVTGMMSTAGKIAAVGTIAPILIVLKLTDLRLLLSILATLTMLYGNIVAIAQNNVKRLLAYSSIASAGYILVGITAMDDFSGKGILFYLLAYIFMQLGAFIVVSVYESATENEKDFKYLTFDEYKGLAKRNPFLAVLLTVFLFSLAGIPPFAGFWGKYYIFYAAIKENLIWLSVIAILLSILSVYYYLKVIIYMWFKDAEAADDVNTVSISPLNYAALGICLAGTFLFGVYPQLFFSFFGFVVK